MGQGRHTLRSINDPVYPGTVRKKSKNSRGVHQVRCDTIGKTSISKLPNLFIGTSRIYNFILLLIE